MDLAQILDPLRQYGDIAYSSVFSFAVINSLLVALFAGYLAHMGKLDWATAVCVCWAGSVLGDALKFWIGRQLGIGWLKSWPRLESAVLRITQLMDRHYIFVLLVHRYPNGIRNLAGLACGISKLPASTFLAVNCLTGGIWAVLVVSIGYGYGHLSDKVLKDAASGVGVAMLVVFLGLMWLLSKKLDRAIERN